MKKLGVSVSDKQRNDVRLARKFWQAEEVSRNDSFLLSPCLVFTIITFAVNLALLASAYWHVILGFNTR